MHCGREALPEGRASLPQCLAGIVAGKLLDKEDFVLYDESSQELFFIYRPKGDAENGRFPV